MKTKVLYSVIYLFTFFIITPNLYALVDLSAEYGLSKSIYGEDEQNNLENKTYTGTLAWYVFSTTALEINYSRSDSQSTQNFTDPGTSLWVSKIDSYITTHSMGVGIRQLLAPVKSSIRPLISLGYAKEIKSYETEYIVIDDTNNSTITVTEDPADEETDSAFATFALEIRLSDHLSLKGSMMSVFPAFEFDKMENNLRYLAGISIYFY
ncbi:MAG: hypothetical protein H6621_02480 [Halobacteriovoraceae bacterium]|nr:hypothetical protein [Halobacteriovoraceae bacterium]